MCIYMYIYTYARTQVVGAAPGRHGTPSRGGAWFEHTWTEQIYTPPPPRVGGV